jgi:hypothetical protein
MKKIIAVFIWLLFAIPCQARIITDDVDDTSLNNGSLGAGADNLDGLVENQDNQDLSGISVGLVV